MYQKFDSKLIGSLIEICQKINVRINYFFFIIIFNFLFFMNLFQTFFKFFKCRLLKKIPGNLQKMFENNETLQKSITE